MHITAMVAAMRGKGLAGQFYIRAVPDMFFSKTNFPFNSNNSLRLGRDGKRCVMREQFVVPRKAGGTMS